MKALETMRNTGRVIDGWPVFETVAVEERDGKPVLVAATRIGEGEVTRRYFELTEIPAP